MPFPNKCLLSIGRIGRASSNVSFRFTVYKHDTAEIHIRRPIKDHYIRLVHAKSLVGFSADCGALAKKEQICVLVVSHTCAPLLSKDRGCVTADVGTTKGIQTLNKLRCWNEYVLDTSGSESSKDPKFSGERSGQGFERPSLFEHHSYPSRRSSLH